jgi:hypothetical protein
MPTATEHWSDTPEAHDFPAAADYLSLLAGQAACRRMVAALRRAPTVTRKAKDLLRAAGLTLLPATDPEVMRDLKKVRKGTTLSPVLLVRGGLAEGRPLTVADGYHRICASYHIDENAAVRCRIVDLPPQAGR